MTSAKANLNIIVAIILSLLFSFSTIAQNLQNEKVLSSEETIFKGRLRITQNGELIGYLEQDPMNPQKTNYFDPNYRLTGYSLKDPFNKDREDFFDVNNKLASYTLKSFNVYESNIFNSEHKQIGVITKNPLTMNVEIKLKAVSPTVTSKAPSFSEQYIPAIVPQIKPFSPDFSSLEAAMATATKRHEELLRAGYVFDKTTKSYRKAAEVAIEHKSRAQTVKLVEDAHLSDVNNSSPFNDGVYEVKCYSPNHAGDDVQTGSVQVKGQRIMLLTTHGGLKWKPTGNVLIRNGVAYGRFKHPQLNGFSNIKVLVFKD